MSVTITISTPLFGLLKTKASEFEPHEDDWRAFDYTGGNIDDAYDLGANYAERELASWVIRSYEENKV